MIPTQKGGASLPPGDGFPAYMDKLMEKVKAIRRELAKKLPSRFSPTPPASKMKQVMSL